METNDYVSYELAVKLKAAGFDEPCDHYYAYDEKSKIKHLLISASPSEWDWNYSALPEFVHPECSAPHIYHAQKWLREKHKLHILVDSDLYGKWYYKVFPIGECCIDEGNSNYVTYEQALSAGIESALRLIGKGE